MCQDYPGCEIEERLPDHTCGCPLALCRIQSLREAVRLESRQAAFRGQLSRLTQLSRVLRLLGRRLGEEKECCSSGSRDLPG